ncbi:MULTISPECIES: NAD(P)-dependent oxidoreductase [Peptoniphilus]|uniref:NAD(P)-dependent oxidoreductase n=1 Tax=Peptoniphilus TaxID=162289 RepID=UPI0003B89FA8|nr:MULTISPECIES: NAD(P)-dependent oxidoreductase [Peptoniphilus]ERT64854.1 putative NAD(P)-binding protein [Peptoniphilus sp. BV3AC2]
MRYIPVSLDTKDKNVLVLGGGVLVLETIKKLLLTEVHAIYIIASEILPDITKLEEENPERIKIKIMDIDENFRFFGYDMVIIGTYNLNLNNALENRALNSNLAYQRLDIKSESSFIIDDFYNVGDISLSVSRTSSLPEIEEEFSKDLKDLVSDYNEDKINLLKQIRTNLIRKNAKDIEKTIEKLYKDDTVNLREYLNSDIEEQEEIKEEKDLNKEASEKNLELEAKDDLDKEENK